MQEEEKELRHTLLEVFDLLDSFYFSNKPHSENEILDASDTFIDLCHGLGNENLNLSIHLHSNSLEVILKDLYNTFMNNIGKSQNWMRDMAEECKKTCSAVSTLIYLRCQDLKSNGPRLISSGFGFERVLTVVLLRNGQEIHFSYPPNVIPSINSSSTDLRHCASDEYTYELQPTIEKEPPNYFSLTKAEGEKLEKLISDCAILTRG